MNLRKFWHDQIWPGLEDVPPPSSQVPEVLARIAAFRREEGACQPVRSAALCKLASFRLQDMQHRHYFDHHAPEGGYGICHVHRDYGAAVAECLCFGSKSAEAAVEAWKQSPPHRAGLLAPGPLIGAAAGWVETSYYGRGICHVFLIGGYSPVGMPPWY